MTPPAPELPEEPLAVVRTFLIADVRGYTRFTREHGSGEAARLAERFAQLVRDAVEARSGRVIELRGDEALAVFSSSAQAVRAAVEFQATCVEMTAADPELPLPVGIGIDSGAAVPVEDGFRGEPLNMAARLCSSAGAGQVLVSRAILNAVSPVDTEVGFVEQGPASFKGFEQLIEVFEAVLPVQPLLEPMPASADDPGIPPLLDPLTPLIGRAHELRWLRGTWRQVRRGHGRLLCVSGPSQIGKTRLAAEIAGHVHADGGTIRYAGQGGAATALALAELRACVPTAASTLLVLDDVDVAGPAVTEALLAALPDIGRSALLVLAVMHDADAPDLMQLVERADERGDGHRVMEPLDLDGVRGIVRLYVGEDDAEVPVESMARASQGVPGRVHEVVSDWARAEASRRLASAAEFLAAGKRRHASDLEFANNVIGLKLGRLYSVDGADTAPATGQACPYKGLESYTEDDSAYFFGRERLVGELAARTVQTGLLGVVGPSGSGKSSVIGAGLLPSLRAGLLPGSEDWLQVYMRPGEHPLQELRQRLSTVGADTLDQAIAGDDDQRLVLVVDQFEETFTVCAMEQERAAFIAALTTAAERHHDRLVVILAIRGDHYGHCAAYPGLAQMMAENNVLVGPLTREELVRAIELPARRVGLRVESALSAALVSEVADEPGGLPLLSTALVELWQARAGRWIRIEDYERTGGVRGAVARLAELSYAQLTDMERIAARRVFLRLVATGEGEAFTRRRVTLDEFDVDREATTADVLARLTHDRLLTSSEGTVEVAHEALLREWPRLQEWLEDDAEGRRLRQHLTQASRHWQNTDRDASELYRGARLSATLDWAADRRDDLNELERQFLDESRQSGEREAERQRRTNRRLRTLLAGVAVFLVVAVIAGVVAVVQQRSAQRSAHRAQRSRTVALSESLGAQSVAEPRLDLAMLMANEGVDLNSSVQTRSYLLTTLLRTPTAVRTLHWTGNRNSGVQLSPDGRTIAIDDNNGPVVLEDTASGRRLGTFNNPRQIAFGPDGAILNAAAHRIDVLNPSTLHRDRSITLPARDGTEWSITAFDGTGTRLAVATVASHDPATNRIVQLDYATGKPAGPTIEVPVPPATGGGPVGVEITATYLRGHRLLITGAVTSVYDADSGKRLRSYPDSGNAAVSPDGSIVAFGGERGTVRFLHLASGRVTPGVSTQPGGIDEIGFTPDGRTLITSGENGTSALWSVASRKITQTLSGHAGPIHAQAISSDGSTLYTGSFDSNVLAWDLTGRRSFVRSFQAADSNPQFKIWNEAVSPDGKTIAVGGLGGIVNLWDYTTLRKIGSFQAGPGWATVSALSFSSDSRSLVVVGNDPALQRRSWLRVWRLGATPHLLHPITGLHYISWATWSPDGKAIAATGWQNAANPTATGALAEWNAATGLPLAAPMAFKGGYPIDIVFAPHGTAVAVSGSSAITETANPVTGQVLSRFHPGGLYILGVAYSPDGKHLATAGWDGNVDIWDAATGRKLKVIPDSDQAVIGSIAWSPSGRTIAITDWQGTLRLYDIASGLELGPPYVLTTPPAQDNPYVTYTPSGSAVVVSDDSGKTWILPATVNGWQHRACAIANRDFTRAEWRQYVPGTPYRRVCSG